MAEECVRVCSRYPYTSFLFLSVFLFIFIYNSFYVINFLLLLLLCYVVKHSIAQLLSGVSQLKTNGNSNNNFVFLYNNFCIVLYLKKIVIII